MTDSSSNPELNLETDAFPSSSSSSEEVLTQEESSSSPTSLPFTSDPLPTSSTSNASLPTSSSSLLSPSSESTDPSESNLHPTSLSNEILSNLTEPPFPHSFDPSSLVSSTSLPTTSPAPLSPTSPSPSSSLSVSNPASFHSNLSLSSPTNHLPPTSVSSVTSLSSNPLPLLSSTSTPLSFSSSSTTSSSSINNHENPILATVSSASSNPPSAPILTPNPMDMSPEMQENLALMDPDNPLLERVQEALFKQLSRANDQMDLEIREKEEALRKAKDQRESIGVELFTCQHQLRTFQTHLEQLEQQVSLTHEEREQAEHQTQEALNQLDQEQTLFQTQTQTWLTRQKELEHLMRTQSHLEQYCEDLKSKLITTRRVTMKAEEALVQQEQEKKLQDLQLFQWSERVIRLQEQVVVLEQQLEYQKKEIQTSKTTLQEANLEMEALIFEKRQLVHQWKTGLLAMQRRQEVLSELDTCIMKEKETLLSMQHEMDGFKKSLDHLASENETLSMLDTKLETETKRLEVQVQQTHSRQDELKTQYGLLQTSLEHHEHQLKQLQLSRQSTLNEVNALKKQCSIAHQTCLKLEKEMEEQGQWQQSIDKSMVGTMKDVKKVISSIHEKENEVAMNENQVASLKLDTTTCQHWNDQLHQQLKELDQVIQEKNTMIEKYEVELRRGNDDMTKKQSEIDVMNKKLSHLVTQTSEEALGPLEATIHNLSKLVTNKEKESWGLQQSWLKNQHELVQLTKQSQDVFETLSTMKMRYTILTRKKQMLNQEFDAQEKEIKYHLRNIKALQNEMTKINGLLSKQMSVQTQLEENNLGLEQEFRYRLKEAELTSLRLEQKVKDLKIEKEQALIDLMDTERHIMLWEKKIQLAKETREALDPNIGAQEMKEMKMEIHRMELRLSNLQKVQEKLIKEMEKGIVRRETIALRSKLRGQKCTQAALNKSIMDLNKQLKWTFADLRDLDQDQCTLIQAHQSLTNQIQETEKNIHDLQTRHHWLLDEMQLKLETKTMMINELSLMQKKNKRYQSLKEGKYHLTNPDPEYIRGELQKAHENLAKVEKAVEILMAEQGSQLGTVVDSLQSHFTTARQFVSGH